MEDVGFIPVCDPCSVQFSEPQAGGGSHRGDEWEAAGYLACYSVRIKDNITEQYQTDDEGHCTVQSWYALHHQPYSLSSIQNW